jgi:sensor histidine kinase YesM
LIIGLFWGLAIGVLAALCVYWLMRQRIERLLSALQNNQRRLQQLENEHEIRLRAATDQLQIEYERQLAEKIEYYQDQQMLQSELMALDFETRLGVTESALSREINPQP